MNRIAVGCLLVAFVAGTCGAAPAKEIKDFHESEIWKQSLAYDAPVIAPEKTLALLEQMRPLMPSYKGGKFNARMAGKYDVDLERYEAPIERWSVKEAHRILSEKLDQLIELSDLDRPYLCDPLGFKTRFDGYDTEYRRRSKLFSVDGQKGYGPNILSYVAYCKDKVMGKCNMN